MIENGVLTYGNANESIVSWRFADDVLNELAIAVLLTILSYQLTESLINLSFGLKRNGRARLRDIQIMLLIRKTSPTAILRSFCVWTRRRSNGEARDTLESDNDDDDDDLEEDNIRGTVSNTRVYLKFNFLLLAIPLVNIVTVALSLERDTALTFKEADFGGLAFGLDLNQSIKQWSPLAITPKIRCNGTLLETNAAEFPTAEFYSCVLLQDEEEKSATKDLLSVGLKRVEAEPIFLTVGLGSKSFVFMKRVMVLSQLANESQAEEKKRLHFVSNILTEEEGRLLLQRGFEFAKTYCDSTEGPVLDERKGKQENGVNWIISRRVGCQLDSSKINREESARQIAHEVLDVLTFVNSREFSVRNGDSEDRNEQINQPFFNGDSLVLLKRRRGFVSIPLLAISAFAAVLLRILLEFATKNDLEKGIGLILRDGLGLPCCDSMLCSSDVVARYDSRGNVLYSVERGHDASWKEWPTITTFRKAQNLTRDI